MQNNFYIFILLALILVFCLWAVEKPTTVTEACVTTECHNLRVQNKHVHRPVALGVCKYCHKSVDWAEHAFKLYRTGKELCSNCHPEQMKGKYLHKPLQKGQCGDCHDPHGSNYKALIPVPKVSDLCQKCHEESEKKKHRHEPFTEGECTLCHNNHSSDFQNLLVKNSKRLCFVCHEIAEKGLTRFEYIHTPVVEQGCMQCHAPHGSNYFRFLNEDYPSEFYAPFNIKNYQLCFTCHPPNKVQIKETISLTDFRNGSLNLHYLHVNMPKKGRTCRSCHATHASNHPQTYS